MTKGAIEDRVRLPAQNTMFMGSNLMDSTLEHLRPTLAAIAEA